MERRHRYGGGIVAVGVVLAVIQFVQGIQQIADFEGQEQYIVFTFETLPFVLIGLSLVAVGYWLLGREAFEPDLPRIAAWGVGSVVLFASVGSLLLFSMVVTLGLDPVATDPLDQAPFLAMNMITIGAVVGVLVGLYDAESRHRQRELEAERDRVEQFAQKAADINNYGRELNRSETVDEISSLCIQALQAFLGLTELAFVVIDEESATLVDNTIVGVEEGTLVDLANDVREQEPATVERSAPTRAAVAERTDEVIGAHVTEDDDSAVVLLAFRNGDGQLNEEDIQLLEMLIAHVATALQRATGPDPNAPASSFAE
jgi:hypothetical protein